MNGVIPLLSSPMVTQGVVGVPRLGSLPCCGPLALKIAPLSSLSPSFLGDTEGSQGPRLPRSSDLHTDNVLQ